MNVGLCGNVYSDVSTVCYSRGFCSIESCSCNAGYYGSVCQNSYVCFGQASSDAAVCSAKGGCVGDNICSCAPGYDGNQCQSRNLLWDNVIKPLLSISNKFDGESLKECVLIKGASCYCTYADQNIKLGCTNNAISSIQIKNSELDGNKLDFTTISTLKTLHLSGNPLNLLPTDFNQILPTSIETLILDNTNIRILSNSLNISALTNLRNISFAGTSEICGSFSW